MNPDDPHRTVDLKGENRARFDYCARSLDQGRPDPSSGEQR